MATVVHISTPLQPLPANYTPPKTQPLTPAASTSRLVPAGPAFIGHARRVLNQHSFEEDDAAVAAANLKNGSKGKEDDDVDEGLGGEQEDKELLKSDPKKWKEQDHYAILGLQELRYKATDEQIKKAHRRKVLRHHPDKKVGLSGTTNDDSFFKCIAKAMEVLSDPVKRRQWDSVDPAIDDDDLPAAGETTDDNFYELWSKVFERESRFSIQQPTPSLGNKDSPRKEVEHFYNFWYNVESWRSYEYLDKDVNEGSDSRDEKRHQEKKNRSDRAARKKADIARLRTVVDKALAADPRMRRYKAEDKAAREAKRKGGAAGGVSGGPVDAKKKEEEEKKKAEEEKKKKEEEEKAAAEEKSNREAAKKAKQAAAKNVKKDKKAIASLVTSNNYFAAPGTSPSPSTIENQLSELDLIFGSLEPEEISEFKKEAEAQQEPAKIKAVVASWASKVAPKVGEGKFKEFVAS